MSKSKKAAGKRAEAKKVPSAKGLTRLPAKTGVRAGGEQLLKHEEKAK